MKVIQSNNSCRLSGGQESNNNTVREAVRFFHDVAKQQEQTTQIVNADTNKNDIPEFQKIAQQYATDITNYVNTIPPDLQGNGQILTALAQNILKQNALVNAIRKLEGLPPIPTPQIPIYPAQMSKMVQQITDQALHFETTNNSRTSQSSTSVQRLMTGKNAI